MDDLLDIAPCGILLFDDGGNVLSANKTLKDLLGYSDHELEGKTVDTIFSVATRIFYNTHLFPVIKLHARADEIFLTLVTKDRKDIPVLSNAVRRQNDGKFENLAVFVPLFERNKFEQEIIEARRTAEKALKENKELQALTETLESRTRELEQKNQKIIAVNDDLTQFNKIISHDLQEPIRKIKLFSSMLSASGSDQLSERSRMALSKIESATERLSKLTLSLQQYVNVDVDVKYTLVDLNNCLSAAASRVSAARDFDDFELLSGELPSIEGFPAQLELLFYHLIDNAIQYRSPERKLKISLDHTVLEENVYRSIPDKYNFAEHVRIIFSDNGIGFDNQFKEYVFDMIKKINIGSDGIGMGLALIKKIVSNHGGTVTVESRHGEGSQFSIVMPLRMGKS